MSTAVSDVTHKLEQELELMFREHYQMLYDRPGLGQAKCRAGLISLWVLSRVENPIPDRQFWGVVFPDRGGPRGNAVDPTVILAVNSDTVDDGVPGDNSILHRRSGNSVAWNFREKLRYQCVEAIRI